MDSYFLLNMKIGKWSAHRLDKKSVDEKDVSAMVFLYTIIIEEKETLVSKSFFNDYIKVRFVFVLF